MSVTKKILCLLLALSMLVCAFAGCTQTPADNGDPTGEGDATGGDETTAENADETTDKVETEDPKTRDDLASFPGFATTQEFLILSRSSTAYEFESLEGDKLSGVEQAVYNRNAEVMQRCNVEIAVRQQAGDWDDRTTFMQTVRNDAKLPQSEFSLIATHSPYLMQLAVEGVGRDFADLPNVDLTKRWWSESFYESGNYMGKQYIAFGDLAHTLYAYLLVVFFNDQIAQNYEIDGLYDLALEGGWTYAKMEEYTKMVTTNLDAAEEDRVYGWLSNGQSVRMMLSGFNIDLLEKNADGIYEAAKKIPASIEGPAQMIVDFCAETVQVYNNRDVDNGVAEENPMFVANRALFYTQMLGEATVFKRDMQADYGVLPLPKYDGTQVDYRSGYRDDMTAVMVPYLCKDEELSGTVTEMLAMVGWEQVTDVYYEEVLKYQSFNDPKCVATIELIRTSFNPTFASMYSCCINTINSMVSNTLAEALDGKGTTVSNYYTTNVGTWRRSIRDLYIELDKLVVRDSAE